LFHNITVSTVFLIKEMQLWYKHESSLKKKKIINSERPQTFEGVFVCISSVTFVCA